MPFSRILQGIFRAIYHDQTTKENSKLGTMCIFWGEKFDLPYFSKIRKFNISCDVIKSKLGQKKVKFIPTVIKKFKHGVLRVWNPPSWGLIPYLSLSPPGSRRFPLIYQIIKYFTPKKKSKNIASTKSWHTTYDMPPGIPPFVSFPKAGTKLHHLAFDS